MANIEASMVKGKGCLGFVAGSKWLCWEGSGSNFFMVKDNKIYTPYGKDILRGITMETIIHELAPSLDIEVIEKNIEPFDVYNADEAFLTSTPFCILPAVTLNKLKIGDGRPGKITNMLLKNGAKSKN